MLKENNNLKKESKKDKKPVCTYGCEHEHLACLHDFEHNTSETIKYSGSPRCLAALDSENHPEDHTGITWQMIYVNLEFICFEQGEMWESVVLLYAVSLFHKYLLLGRHFVNENNGLYVCPPQTFETYASFLYLKPYCA